MRLLPNRFESRNENPYGFVPLEESTLEKKL